MWFATQDGLNRYDGYTFVVYKNHAEDSSTISNNFILDLMEDKQGNLWLGTISDGINKIDPVTNNIINYRHDPGNRNSISDNAVESILQDSYGNFWFGTTRNGLNKFDPKSKTFIQFVKDAEGKSIGRVTKVIEDKRKHIWFTGERGLFHLDIKTAEITRPPATMNILSADYIYEDEAGIFWILAWNPAALIKYNPATEQLTEYPCDAIGLWSCNLVEDGKQGFWISTKKGLCYFNRQTEQFRYVFQQDETNPDGLNDNFVSSIYRDRAGLLWLGTEKGGVNIVNFQKEQFDSYRHKPGNPNSLLPGRVTAVHIDDNGILWLGYTPLALSRIDRKSGKITHYTSKHGDKYSLGRGATIRSIFRDSRDYLWLGGWESGLTRFDERTGQFKQYLPKQDDANSLISDKVYCILEDNNRNLWIGQKGGLSRFNPEKERFTNYRHDRNNPNSLRGDNVYSMSLGHNGIIWMGTSDGVLTRLDINNETFGNFVPDPHSSNLTKGKDFYAICESRSGTLWLGLTNGLYRFNEENGTFTRYTEIQGLSDNCVNGILEDDTGMLWVSTLNGLSRFDPQKEIFRNYDKTNGLQDNDFSEGCYGKSKDGEMFFGCSNGLLAFFPGNIHDNPYAPPIVLTDFRIFGKSVPVSKNSVLQQNINETKSLTLPYNLNTITFGFSALSYAAPQKNQYRYILEGFDKDWYNTNSKERLAVYTSLPAGSYVFRVQGSNQDGVWNKEGKSIKIIITPPWWKTWWFRSIIVLVVLALAFSVHFLRVINIKKYNRKLEKEVAERTEQLDVANEELSVTNDELEATNESLIMVNKELEIANKELEAFSYSVSHDLKAPLRHIEGFSQILSDNYQNKIDDQGKSYLQRIQGSALRMSQLIEDMLSLSRISRSEMMIQDVNLGTIAKEIADNLRESQPGRSVNFSICDELPVKGDGKLLRIVLENLIGNAWKYTSKHQSANIEVGFKKQDNTTFYYVRDDGAGFDMNYAKKLFGVFQRLHRIEEFEGTGIGLATVQRIIHRHGGKVWAESEVEKGATFYFTIP
jgi:signal transduction histidine kinase/ligand-binding sensor domain-containing protein